MILSFRTEYVTLKDLATLRKDLQTAERLVKQAEVTTFTCLLF